MSLTPLTKIGVLLGRAEVVPAGMLPRGSDMSSQDMHLMAASGEAAGSEESEPLALGLGCPIGS